MKEYSLDCPYYTRTFSTLDDLIRDIIMTGTPDGVGNGRGEFLKAGDVVRVRIEGLGEVVNKMT